MTDKQKIRAEIGKLKSKYNKESDFRTVRGDTAREVLDKLLSFIDSLPEKPASEDLEEAAKQHSKQTFNGILIEDNIDAFKAGAEWQKQQMKEALQTEYEKGRFDMREEMMKVLIGGEIVKDIHNQLSVKSEPLNNAFGDIKFGDKVKIIIVK